MNTLKYAVFCLCLSKLSGATYKITINFSPISLDNEGKHRKNDFRRNPNFSACLWLRDRGGSLRQVDVSVDRVRRAPTSLDGWRQFSKAPARCFVLELPGAVPQDAGSFYCLAHFSVLVSFLVFLVIASPCTYFNKVGEKRGSPLGADAAKIIRSRSKRQRNRKKQRGSTIEKKTSKEVCIPREHRGRLDSLVTVSAGTYNSLETLFPKRKGASPLPPVILSGVGDVGALPNYVRVQAPRGTRYAYAVFISLRFLPFSFFVISRFYHLHLSHADYNEASIGSWVMPTFSSRGETSIPASSAVSLTYIYVTS